MQFCDLSLLPVYCLAEYILFNIFLGQGGPSPYFEKFTVSWVEKKHRQQNPLTATQSSYALHSRVSIKTGSSKSTCYDS